MHNILFICSRNRWRSPTTEQVFAGYPGITCSSAGLNTEAENLLTPDQVEWADIIFVMEAAHKTKLSARFKKYLSGKRVISLNIPDKYTLMEPALVNLLKAKVTPFLPKG